MTTKTAPVTLGNIVLPLIQKKCQDFSSTTTLIMDRREYQLSSLFCVSVETGNQPLCDNAVRHHLSFLCKCEHLMQNVANSE
jgi:hypothetical protein